MRFLFIVALLALSNAAHAQDPTSELKLDTGQEIFEAACIACHGPGGRGQPQTTLGFEPPATFPDFSDCFGSVREKTFDWRATIHEGGHGRGFSEIMPSFAEALTLDQINKVVQYLRTLCDDRSEERRVGKECRSRRSQERSSRRRHTRYWRDWSSDVCSSDLHVSRFLRLLWQCPREDFRLEGDDS